MKALKPTMMTNLATLWLDYWNPLTRLLTMRSLDLLEAHLDMMEIPDQVIEDLVFSSPGDTLSEMIGDARRNSRS
jgi:hypothetical protein